MKTSRRGALTIVEASVLTPFLLICAYVAGILTGGPVGLAVALLVAALTIWRAVSRHVSVDEQVVIVHGWGRPRRLSGVSEVSAVRSEVGILDLPVSGVAVTLGGGEPVELEVLKSIPLSFKYGDAQARRSAAWLAGHLGMVQVDEDTWQVAP